MFELSDEKLIMYSDDRTVTLTTHRIIHEAHGRRGQIMLEDYVNYKTRTAHIGLYKPITIFFLIASILLLIRRLEEYFTTRDNEFLNFMSRSIILFISIFLLGISYHFYLISRRYFIRLEGKYNSIEFRVVRPNKKTVLKFLNAITSESQRLKTDNIKKV